MTTSQVVRRRSAVALAIAAAITVGTGAPAAAAPPPGSGCAEVEVIALRGTDEPQGGGTIAGPLALALQEQLSQTVRTHDVVYPATYNYGISLAEGKAALRDRLRRTSTECPDIGFVLVGYSQGAHVIGEILASGSVPDADRIEAVVFFGDPTFNGNEPYGIGSYQRGRNGIFPRVRGTLSEFADVIGSYCNSDDTVCQAGASGSGHDRYADDRQAAVEFVRAELG